MGDEMDESYMAEDEDKATFDNIVGESGMGGFSESPDRKKRAEYFTIGLDDEMSISTIDKGSILNSSFDERPPPPPKKTKQKDQIDSFDLDEVTLPETPQSEQNPDRKKREDYFTIGLDDDRSISTIANGSVLNSSFDERPPPPPKKTKQKDQINCSDPDEATLPETPQSEHGQKQFDTEGVSKLKLPRKDPCCAPRMKRDMCIAFILGCIILGAIGVLSYALIENRSDPKERDADDPDFDVSPGFNSSSDIAGTQAPADPIAAQPQLTPVPTNLRASSPTQSPTTYSTQAPTISNFDDLLEAVSLISQNSIEALNTEFSAQRVALQWLSIDPNLSEYSEERIVQRWAMATFFLSISGENASSGRALQMDDNETEKLDWMTYTDECTWYSTQCSKDGKLLGIYLEDIGLAGVLPPEISLLSDSLERIDLSSNEIRGTIPTEWGLLTNLLRLQLADNNLEGTIPPQLGLMENLRVLGLGRNQIGGTLPSELGLLSNLGILGLEANRLNGTIPAEYADMASLTVMSLKNNELSGTVPSELGRLSSLSTLTLHDNNLSGQVPLEVCNIAMIDILNVDCDEISCSCCTECSAPSAPTPSPTPDLSAVSPVPPTLSPTFAPSASLESTFAPTRTECPHTILSSKSCYLVGEPLVFEFHICDGATTDLISLYEEAATFSFTMATFWTRTCGLPFCRATLGDNIMNFDNLQAYEMSFSSWPAAIGSYKLRLLRVTHTGPVAPIAESAVIEIREQCN